MSKTKRISILLFLVILIGSYFIIPLFDNFEPTKTEEANDEIFAKFIFSDNLTLRYGVEKKLGFKVFSSNLSKIELVISDKLIQTWNNPKGVKYFVFNSNEFLLGAQEVKLNIYRNNTLISEDSKLIRVLSDVSPKKLTAHVKSLTPHNPLNFTQGLEFYQNQLLEGSGQYGESKIMKIDFKTGNSITSKDVDASCFGEGITVLNDKLYEITWKEQKCFVYDVQSFNLEKTISYVGEGWGLCNDGTNLIMSDGSERIYFRSPTTFEILRTIEVYDNLGPKINLNELEYINGKIYANVWQANYILEIDPQNGKVEKIIDCGDIIGQARGAGEVLNGIAYNKQTNKIYLTGKNWAKIAEVEFK